MDTAERQRFALGQKLSEIQTEIRETQLVLDALAEADKTRKCMRMVGGVLVERTVAEVETALKAHMNALEVVLKNLDKELTDMLHNDSTKQTQPTDSSKQTPTPSE